MSVCTPIDVIVFVCFTDRSKREYFTAAREIERTATRNWMKWIDRNSLRWKLMLIDINSWPMRSAGKMKFLYLLSFRNRKKRPRKVQELFEVGTFLASFNSRQNWHQHWQQPRQQRQWYDKKIQQKKIIKSWVSQGFLKFLLWSFQLRTFAPLSGNKTKKNNLRALCCCLFFCLQFTK